MAPAKFRCLLALAVIGARTTKAEDTDIDEIEEALYPTYLRLEHVELEAEGSVDPAYNGGTVSLPYTSSGDVTWFCPESFPASDDVRVRGVFSGENEDSDGEVSTASVVVYEDGQELACGDDCSVIDTVKTGSVYMVQVQGEQDGESGDPYSVLFGVLDATSIYSLEWEGLDGEPVNVETRDDDGAQVRCHSDGNWTLRAETCAAVGEVMFSVVDVDSGNETYIAFDSEPPFLLGGKDNVTDEPLPVELDPGMYLVEAVGSNGGFASTTIELVETNETIRFKLNASGATVEDGDVFDERSTADGWTIVADVCLIDGLATTNTVMTDNGDDSFTVSALPLLLDSIDISVVAAYEAPWELKAEAGSKRMEHSFVEVDGTFYSVGGLRRAQDDERDVAITIPLPVEAYNIESDSWTEGALEVAWMHHVQAAQVGGTIYVVSAWEGIQKTGEIPISNVYEYDVAADEWSVGSTIVRARGGAGVAAYDGAIFVAGGTLEGHSGGGVKWFDRYDPADDTWMALADVPRYRDHYHAAVYDKKFYCAGGRRTFRSGGFPNERLVIPEVDVYDFDAGVWTTLDAMLPTPRAGTSAAVVNGWIVILGGETLQDLAHVEVEAYDPRFPRWFSLADFTNETRRHAAGAAAINGALYIQGGNSRRAGNTDYYLSNIAKLQVTAPES